jgi:hypothetical protein
MSEASMNNNLNTINCESQNAAIARYLEEGGRLTPLQALDLFGCFRLAARIDDLRKKGMDIQTNIIRVQNEKGRVVRVGEYWLSGGE